MVQQTFALALHHHRAGRLGDAEALYRQVLAAQPNHPEALHHLGVIAHQVGRHDLAVDLIRQSIVLNPNSPAAHSNLGEAHRVMGRLDEAVDSHRRALQLRPDHPEMHNNLGLALAEQGQFDEAIANYRRALQLKPDYPEACYNLGTALGKQDRLDEAVTALRRALELKPGDPEAHNNLGTALTEQGQFGEAMAAYRRALQLKPDYAEAHSNLGTVLADQGQFDEAIAAHRRALQLQPDNGNAKFHLSLQLLLRGDFERGWPLYEARWEASQSNDRNLTQPRWDGSTLEGRRVLVHAEQGFGDSIQFIRYAPLTAGCGGEVIVECPRSLVELFRSMKAVSEVVAAGDALPPFDLHVPMLSQPLIFKTTLESIPREVPYLFADPVRRETWRGRLDGNRSHLKVGLAWAGNPQIVRQQKRHIALDKLLPVLHVEGVDFFSLQVDRGAEQIWQLSGAARIIDHTEHIHDFADTAAFISELDLIISVDTAVAHLAGALGRPVWTLLPFVPDWRWGSEGEQTPWYPTMRLFRQPAAGDWDSVIRRVVVELTKAVTERASKPEL